MNDSNCIDLFSLTVVNQPFPHFYSTAALHDNIDSRLFDWFENTTEWHLTETDFYEQFEFSFLSAELPEHLECLISKKTISKIEEKLKAAFSINSVSLVGVMAHKLVNGQHIGIHNDYINGEETHRMVIHINTGWNPDNGGILMLFNSSKADDISKLISPVNNTAFGFEISNRSHHAVSKIYNYTRYTLVYTFKENK